MTERRDGEPGLDATEILAAGHAEMIELIGRVEGSRCLATMLASEPGCLAFLARATGNRGELSTFGGNSSGQRHGSRARRVAKDRPQVRPTG